MCERSRNCCQLFQGLKGHIVYVRPAGPEHPSDHSALELSDSAGPKKNRCGSSLVNTQREFIRSRLVRVARLQQWDRVPFLVVDDVIVGRLRPLRHHVCPVTIELNAGNLARLKHSWCPTNAKHNSHPSAKTSTTSCFRLNAFG